MARNKSEWPAKVLALVRGGNLPAAQSEENFQQLIAAFQRQGALPGTISVPRENEPVDRTPVRPRFFGA